MDWADLVQPAIDLAENGFELSFTLANHARNFLKDQMIPS
jgi:gamma-glutamyltranspeptidase